MGQMYPRSTQRILLHRQNTLAIALPPSGRVDAETEEDGMEHRGMVNGKRVADGERVGLGDNKIIVKFVVINKI